MGKYLNYRQRQRIHYAATRILGKLANILKVKTNGISLESMRKLCNDIYLRVDHLVEVIDQVEKGEIQ